MRLYFVERLSLRNWLGCIRPVLLRAAQGPADNVRIYYVDADSLALRVAARWLAARGITVQRLVFDAGHLHHADGLLLWLRVYYRDMALALDCIERSSGYSALLKHSCGEPNLAAFLRKEIVPGKSIVASTGWWRAIYLIQVCVSQLAQLGGIEAVFFLRRRVFMDALADFARRAGAIELVSYGAGGEYYDALLRLLAPDVRFVLGSLRSLLRGDFGRLRPRSGTGPRVAVQSFGHANLDRPELHSDLFFWQQSDLPAANLLLLFGTPQDSLDRTRADAIAGHGMAAIALSHEATQLGASTVFAGFSAGQSALRVLEAFGASFGSEDKRWLAGETALFRARVQHWQRLCEAFRVRILVTWFKYSAEHCAMAEAAQSTGGVLAVYQRSYEGNGTVQGSLNADVYFAFSKDAARVERESRSRIRYGVVTGYLGDHRFALAGPAAKDLRRRLAESGARFVAAYFDENSSEDPRWIPGHDRQRRPYAFLLEKVLREPEFGLILKPKTPRSLRHRLGDCAQLLDRAIATGRCAIHEAGALQSSTPPAEAALAADLVIHGSVAAGTAGIEAALTGTPTVLVDEDAFHISPLARLGPSVVFVDWDVLWQTWHAHRSGAGGIRGFADWSGMLDELDPYRDGRSAERMGTFLHWLLGGIEAGMAADAALDVAVARYAERWGADKVFSVLP